MRLERRIEEGSGVVFDGDTGLTFREATDAGNAPVLMARRDAVQPWMLAEELADAGTVSAVEELFAR